MYEPLRVFTQPLTVLLILLAMSAALALRRTARPLWRWTVLALTLLLFTSAHPYAAWTAARALESQYPPVAPEGPLPQVRALVVLSGGLLAGARGEGVLAEDSLVRTVCAADLARRIGPDVVLASGGVVNSAAKAAVAERMRDLLVLMGVAADRILVDSRARTTFDNAQFSKALLAPRGIVRIGLVTEALHMPRSVGVFRAAGFDVAPLPCAGQTGPTFAWSPSNLLPGPRAAWIFNRAAHEWIGLEYYRLSGAWK